MRVLDNIRVLELAGLAPGPFTGLLLADNGANVLRVDRVQPGHSPSPDVLIRGKSSICVDLKDSPGREFILRLIPHADVSIDPFRPGVLERLGLGPDVLLEINPRLILARLTGFRRDGKYATMAGHDLNYLAVSGVLSMLGPAVRTPPLGHPLPPSPPGNILADFAGGGLVCFVGILLALFARVRTGKGQVVEANMVDGVSYLATAPRISSKIPGVYECKDPGTFMAVAALEPKFFEALSRGIGLGEKDWGGKRDDRSLWPAMHLLFEESFRKKTRKEWETIFDGTDACCTPVLTHSELEVNHYDQRPAVALSDTPSVVPGYDGWSFRTLSPGKEGETMLHDWTGWKKGKDYVFIDGGLCSKEVAKI